MSVNSSAAFIHTRLPSFISSSVLSGLLCLTVNPNTSVFTAFTITNVLLLFPVCILVLYHRLQRWRRRRHRPSSTAASHSDTFTCHLATMELLNISGSVLCCCGIYSNTFLLLVAWYFCFCLAWYGEAYFHVLSCMEHYLAVVHPITYLGLRKERGTRIRNIIIGLIWLLCLSGATMIITQNNTSPTDNCLLLCSVLIISFCSLSVLWALTHPGPGEQGRDQRRLTQSKQRAFYTIMTIFAVLLVRFVVNISWNVVMMLNGSTINCSLMMLGIGWDLPSSLVLPLLYLHKAGKFTCCKEDVKD